MSYIELRSLPDTKVRALALSGVVQAEATGESTMLALEQHPHSSTLLQGYT
jgi:hypothetical protein